MQRDRSNVPDLGHAGDHASDTKAEGQDGGKARRKLRRLVVVFGHVTVHAALVEEVLRESDTLIDGEPVA